MEKRLKIPLGTADVFGHKMRLRKHALKAIEQTYEQFGFELLSTPIIENAIVFNGHHGEGEKLLFNLKDKQGNDLVLRYDLTVPLARVMAMYPEIPRPFKRYQIAQSFRDDDVDHGHFREFIQCDGDIVGSSDPIIDSEIILIAASGLKKIGFNSFKIRLNHRKIIRALARCVSQNCDTIKLQRALDFADKTTKSGLESIRKDFIHRGFTDSEAEKITEIISIKGSPYETLESLQKIFLSHKEGIEGITELKKIIDYLPEETYKHVSVDLTLARGADYYTGFILEGIIPNVPVGAVLGGGRYDNLMSSAGGNHEPATGMAFGLERIMTAMEDLNVSTDNNNPTILLYTEGSMNPKRMIEKAQKLRAAGFMVDLNNKIKDIEEAEDYAKKRNYPIAIRCSNKNDDIAVLKNNCPLSPEIIQTFI